MIIFAMNKKSIGYENRPFCEGLLYPKKIGFGEKSSFCFLYIRFNLKSESCKIGKATDKNY